VATVVASVVVSGVATGVSFFPHPTSKLATIQTDNPIIIFFFITKILPYVYYIPHK
jgi:hypothetical protein